MKSRFELLRPEAIVLRQKGMSIRDIEVKLGIPRSTLSGWLKNIQIAKQHQEILYQNWLNALVLARTKAVIWHNAQKQARLAVAEKEAQEVLHKINFNNRETIELALALLYLGEGAKKSLKTALGNSDPLILRFFVRALNKIYGITPEQIRCELHLRADQDPTAMKKYWAEQLNLPLSSFRKASLDQRTKGTVTYSHYKGVCVVDCANVAIQRRLMYIAIGFCEQIASDARG